MRCSAKRGQVWIETVIYTLIGLTIIGLVLAAALPKINAKKDEIMIDQAIQVLGVIDEKIYEVIEKGVMNRRTLDLNIGKGRLIIDMTNDKIYWVLDSSFEYSEPGLPVAVGSLNVTTREADPWEVSLELNYGADIRFDNKTSGTKELDSSPTPYKLMIENKGNLVVNLRVS